MRAWAVAFGLAAALALSACGQHAKRPERPSGELRIYNWPDYIDPQLLADFTQETGVKVVYDTFDSPQTLEGKLLPGPSGYDLVVPANQTVPRLVRAQAIQRLDTGQLPHLGNLDPSIVTYMKPFDPDGAYAVPYMWGTIGLGYDQDAVAKRLPASALGSWDMVFDPRYLAKLKDCGVTFLDSAEDMYALALNYLGRDPNSRTPEDYAAATELLAKVRPYVREFTSSDYIKPLARGEICVAVSYSGDALQAQAQARQAGGKVKLAYVIPREGSQVWFDVFVVPKGAPNPRAAYAFLEYMLRPEVIARASDFTKYANANAAATPLVETSVRDNPNVYPTPLAMKRLFVTTTKDEALVRQIQAQWVRVRGGHETARP
jgi:putrescine transport system substrate-binding protein